jgi:hypothetical protein
MKEKVLGVRATAASFSGRMSSSSGKLWPAYSDLSLERSHQLSLNGSALTIWKAINNNYRI